MGLDTTYGCWHGPYSAFNRWRTEVARAAGMPIVRRDDEDRREYPALWGEPEWAGGEHAVAVAQGEWDELPEDPLLVLLLHSDCDGIIPVEALLPLAERLEEIAPQMNEDYDRDATARFAQGLRAAAAAGKPVEFW